MAFSIHISELVPGDAIRIAIKTGYQLEPTPSKRNEQPKLIPASKSRVARAYSRTLISGFITKNDPISGIMELQTYHRGRGERLYAATVPYSVIQIIRKIITPTENPLNPKRPGNKPLYGGGRDAYRHPGTFNLSLLASPGLLKLVRVRF